MAYKLKTNRIENQKQQDWSEHSNPERRPGYSEVRSNRRLDWDLSRQEPNYGVIALKWWFI